MAQRMLACANKRQPPLAVLGSYRVVIVGLAFLVGVGLIGYYEHHAMSEFVLRQKPDRVLPVFVREALLGLRGQARRRPRYAISSLDRSSPPSVRPPVPRPAGRGARGAGDGVGRA